MSSDALFDMRDDEHPEKATIVCWCGGAKGKRVSVCYYCFEQLPREVKEGLHKQYGRGYEEAYAGAVKHLAQINGFGDDTRTVEQRKQEEEYDDILASLPIELQELLKEA